MSNPVTESLSGGIERVFGLADAFIEACPEDIWGKKFGGWPVWQHLYHGFGSTVFFVLQEGEKELPAPFDPAVGGLKEVAQFTPSKDEIKVVSQKMKELVRAYVKGISDADLGKKNAGLSGRIGAEMTHAGTLSLIAGHLYYHFGACDAALRENGLKGIF